MPKRRYLTKPITAEQFLEDVVDFCDNNKMSFRDVGVLALNDTAFFGRLRDSKSPTLARIERVYDFMISYEAERQEKI